MVKALDDTEMKIKKSGIKIVTLNARSVKNKDHYIMDCIQKFRLGYGSNNRNMVNR